MIDKQASKIAGSIKSKGSYYNAEFGMVSGGQKITPEMALMS